jgi:diadenosine tetraphosphate (Ap4A) HIT family hydrolase
LSCAICTKLLTLRGTPEFIWENEDWVLQHEPRPYPAVGWCVLYSRQHVPNAAYLPPALRQAFGDVMSGVSRSIMEISGCMRVYVASMCEGTPHFHMHFVPRYVDGPSRWEAFLKLDEAKAGPGVDAEAVAVFVRRLREHLAGRGGPFPQSDTSDADPAGSVAPSARSKNA